ncbi:MAG: hypothetical protein AB1730_25490 [Myxococcota bacterium]
MTQTARALAVAAAALLALPALADDTKVPVQADVVYASTAPGKVEASLLPMQATLAGRVKYTTLKSLSTKRLELGTNKPAQVALPNQKVAEVALESLKDDVATVRVKLPPAETTYKLGRGKSLYLQGGAHDGGELWLVLSMPK